MPQKGRRILVLAVAIFVASSCDSVSKVKQVAFEACEELSSVRETGEDFSVQSYWNELAFEHGLSWGDGTNVRKEAVEICQAEVIALQLEIRREVDEAQTQRDERESEEARDRREATRRLYIDLVAQGQDSDDEIEALYLLADTYCEYGYENRADPVDIEVLAGATLIGEHAYTRNQILGNNLDKYLPHWRENPQVVDAIRLLAPPDGRFGPRWHVVERRRGDRVDRVREEWSDAAMRYCEDTGKVE